MSSAFGLVFSIKDAIAKVTGLTDVTSGEMVKDINGNIGLVLNLEQSWTGVVMFDDNVIMGGDKLFRMFKTLSISSDPSMLGNVYDSIGYKLNHDDFFLSSKTEELSYQFGSLNRGVELQAPGIIVRQPVYETLFTGYIGVDGVIPLGQGQRELIIGDRQTGKTSIAIDSILSQSNIEMLFYRYSLR